MDIRPARVSDASAIARLSGQLGYPMTAEDAAARVRAMEDLPDHAVLVAQPDGVVAGWLHVCRRLTVEREYAEITSLVVDEAARSKGLGARLLAAAEGWAKTAGLAVVRVRSNVIRERAHGFYARHGYGEKKRQIVLEKSL
jgi:GNAT superfamily N-acetyltransferase